MSAVIEQVAEEVVKNRNGKVGAQLPSQAEYSNGTGREPNKKYHPFTPVNLPDRTWPDQKITKAPIWCSVDLRDGNQAIPIPMSVEEKLEMFELLCRVGFKEIEVGFPSASQIEFDFCRRLIEENLIPDDVTVQVLVQCREELIRRSFEALKGARRAIVHFYNSTNPAQRKIVFGMSQEQIKNIAVDAAKLVRELAHANPETQWVAQYSPESFCLTELDFSLDVCQSVMQAWRPSTQDKMPENKIILNLPATVESFTPNVHADQIEWFCRNLKERDKAIISLHTHNDRGTGIAATELALMAGADRVEGTLFGNGERTGNLDIVTVALNLYSQGVEPNLDFSDLPRVREVYERTTRMAVHERHPYAGDLVFTAFSGSHQDAINKGFAQQDAHGFWEVPYLPIDPKDLGRDYERIIRVNSQSGKGGVAHVMERDFGYQLPRELQIEFGKVINCLADEKGDEISGEEMFAAFEREYLSRETPLRLESFHTQTDVENGLEKTVTCIARLANGETKQIKGTGNGPIDAFVNGLNAGVLGFQLLNYSEHSLGVGAQAKAASYIQIMREDGRKYYGVGTDTNIELASIKAVLSAVNRALNS
jgi:2-isopropylmalate synthase